MSSQRLDKFISLHVPKCGGTTLGFILQELYGDKFFWDKSEDSLPIHGKVINYNQAHVQQANVIHGHIHVNKYSFLQRPYITWLRHPVDRLESEYSIIRQKKLTKGISPLHKRIILDKLSFLDYVREIKNVYTNYLGELRVEDFAFIGITELYEESLFVLFQQLLGKEIPPYYRRNTRIIGRQKFKEGTSKEKIFCGSNNQKDIVYYDQAKARLINEFKNCVPVYVSGQCAPRCKR